MNNIYILIKNNVVMNTVVIDTSTPGGAAYLQLVQSQYDTILNYDSSQSFPSPEMLSIGPNQYSDINANTFNADPPIKTITVTPAPNPVGGVIK